MSPLGLTIDLNVFGWLDRYDDAFTPNHIDEDRRYAFGAQPTIAVWNLQRLADAMTGTPFTADREADRESWTRERASDGHRPAWLSAQEARAAVDSFEAQLATCRRARLRLRLGLPLDMSDDKGRAATASAAGASSSAAVATADADPMQEEEEKKKKQTGKCRVDVQCASGLCRGNCCTAKGGLGAACAACGSNGGCIRCSNGFKQPMGVFHCGEDDDAEVEGWIAWLRRSVADYHRANRALAEVLPPLFLHNNTADASTTAVAAAAKRLNSACGGETAALPALQAWLAALVARLRRERDGVGDGPGVVEPEAFARRWAAQVRTAAPHYVLRTAFARAVTGRVQEGLASGSGVVDARAVLTAAARRLQQPFELRPWHFEAVDGEAEFGGEEGGGGDGGGGGVGQECTRNNEIAVWLGAGFSALSPRHRLSMQEVQTSCGGQ